MKVRRPDPGSVAPWLQHHPAEVTQSILRFVDRETNHTDLYIAKDSLLRFLEVACKIEVAQEDAKATAHIMTARKFAGTFKHLL